jgi:hypothetical protein
MLALPYHANVAAAVAKARASKLRLVHLDALTVDQLGTLEFVSAVEIVGCKHALDLLRPRHQIIFCNGAHP